MPTNNLLPVYHCIFVLAKEKTDDIKRNDSFTMNVLVKKGSPYCPIYLIDKPCNIKNLVLHELQQIASIPYSHTEQVYTIDEEKYSYDGLASIIYLSVLSEDQITDLDSNYELLSFKLKDPDTLSIGNRNYSYRTVEVENQKSIQYRHEIDVDDIVLEKQLLCYLISYKYIRSRMDQTDMMFHFLPETFTLEEVRLLYEEIMNKEVDKSNFRKRIIKYCEPTGEILANKGYRPTKMYRFQPLKGDIWL